MQSPSYDLAHDVGCGAGQVAEELASRFSHVTASDNDAAHVDVARSRLEKLATSSSKSSFTHAAAEDLFKHRAPGSVDLIASAEAIVLMDAAAGLRCFARLLKPGGTLAMWFYGRPTFSDPDLFKRAQPIMDEIMVQDWLKVIRGSESKRMARFQRCADAMASWLDFLAFPADTWRDVQRSKWNTYGMLPFFGEEACGFRAKRVSNVALGEQVVINEGPEFWLHEWCLEDLRRYFAVLFPGFREVGGEGDEVIEGLFERLGVEMGGAESRKKFTWPAALVLATRK